jgi:hypothetical protein
MTDASIMEANANATLIRSGYDAFAAATFRVRSRSSPKIFSGTFPAADRYRATTEGTPSCSGSSRISWNCPAAHSAFRSMMFSPRATGSWCYAQKAPNAEDEAGRLRRSTSGR